MTYKVSQSDQVIVTGVAHQHKHVYKIKDLPPDSKPREKLCEQGPETLSVAELVAVLLGVGTKKEEVMIMANRMLHEYGERSLADQRDARELALELDIPIGKATQLVACAELGRRFYRRSKEQLACLRTPEDVYQYTTDMRALPKEQLRGLYLNAHHHVIHDEIISVGTVNSSVIHPREVFRPALAYNAVAVVLVHNHPSGQALVSEADTEVTKQLVGAGKLLGIDLLDHMIVSTDGFACVPITH